MIAGGLEVPVVGALLLLAVNRDLSAVDVQQFPTRLVDSFGFYNNCRLSAARPARCLLASAVPARTTAIRSAHVSETRPSSRHETLHAAIIRAAIPMDTVGRFGTLKRSP
jgi:hypothetical protein